MNVGFYSIALIVLQLVSAPVSIAETTLKTAVASVESLSREFRLDGEVEAKLSA